ncbi:hypothetical protein [Streptosporangium sp. NBC_01469]|uniref:hypothetical protein n=1 Tax=Streptosporangium sp. NBC_01469 TaxID=2903898 RepID=UPI002E2D42C9|nr:hypothetical protein [Streptosporangium sp. NBC_01469]
MPVFDCQGRRVDGRALGPQVLAEATHLVAQLDEHGRAGRLCQRGCDASGQRHVQAAQFTGGLRHQGGDLAGSAGVGIGDEVGHARVLGDIGQVVDPVLVGRRHTRGVLRRVRDSAQVLARQPPGLQSSVGDGLPQRQPGHAGIILLGKLRPG